MITFSLENELIKGTWILQYNIVVTRHHRDRNTAMFINQIKTYCTFYKYDIYNIVLFTIIAHLSRVTTGSIP